MKKIQVLFVCKGNICRSPTAQGTFQKLLNDKNLRQSIIIDSAGTHDYHIGKSPDERAQKAASAMGIDIGGLVGRQVSTEDFDKFDYIIAMDKANLAILNDLCPSTQKHKLSLFLSFAPDVKCEDVPDPFWGDGKDFEIAFTMIKTASLGLLDDIKKKHLREVAEETI
jgi:protein-tyrosine phosphatase